MSYAPATISAVAAYWVAHGGLNGGIIRSIAKQVKPSYHCGRDGVEYYHRTATTDYTIRNARDRAGLTNGAAALDLSWALANKAGLQAFSNWLIAEIQAGAPDTLDVVELVWSPDGTAISGWHRWRGNDIIPNYGDTSHRWHTHIAWIRDTEANDKLGPFRRYFEGEDIIVDPRTLVPLALCDVAPGGTVYADPGRVKVLIPSWAGGTGVGLYAESAAPAAVPPPLLPIRVDFGTGGSDIRLVWVGRDKVSNIRPVADSTPYDQEDIDAAIAADRALAKVTWDA